MRVAVLLLLARLAQAQSGVPAFRADRVLPSGGDQPTPLAPGMLVSIYGTDLGPQAACKGQADPKDREAPNPLRLDRAYVDTLIYPKELCGVQVFLGERPAGLLYVQQVQINFKVPQETPMEGSAPLRVVYQGRGSAAVEMRLGLELATLSLEQPAHVGGPVWVHIQQPPYPRYGDLQYPVKVNPYDFGCNEIDVRRNGSPLPRIPVQGPPGPPPAGLMCGFIGIPGREAPHKNRLPVHLQYRFDQPGAYEVRYTRRSAPPDMRDSQPIFQTAWTRIEILPGPPGPPGAPPQDPVEALGDYLPSILGFPDDAHLALVVGYLYHPTETVRRYASQALNYWPEDVVIQRLTDLLHTRGPSDVVVERTFRTPGAVDFILPSLRSDNPALLRAAVSGVSSLLFADPPLLSAADRARAEGALIAAAENVLRNGESQTGNYYAAALGGVRDPRARDLLWSFVDRNVITEQSLIVITWFKNPADLPRLAALLEAPAKRDPMDRTYASLPYAIHRAYGDAALPTLESALQKSGHVWVQTHCAEELVEAGRKSAFAFIAQAIEENRSYRQELVRFIQNRFPELRGTDDSKVLAFLKAHQ
ncbi:MAG: hypothetical protein ABSC23_13665 [Bryobacteraceae bacterium]|jgi:hypothetical protein